MLTTVCMFSFSFPLAAADGIFIFVNGCFLIKWTLEVVVDLPPYISVYVSVHSLIFIKILSPGDSTFIAIHGSEVSQLLCAMQEMNGTHAPRTPVAV